MVASELREGEASCLDRALELAELGRGQVSPNPLVGAVLVRDGRVIGEGHHAKLGELHAERNALRDCAERGEDPAGATMHVTLEPCGHQGRQPPCADALLEAGVTRVVIASEDPSEKGSGRGPGALRDGGVEVVWASGPQASAARLLNQAFRKHARSGRPLVTLKVALSLDGRVATPDESRWLSGPESRALVHEWRADTDAIAVGIGTALADDPLLTARGSGELRQPLRVVFDSQARLPVTSALLGTLNVSPVICVVSPDAPRDRLDALRERGAELIYADGSTGAERVTGALTELGRREVTSVFLEGGPTLAKAFMSAGEVDEARFFYAPLLVGGGTPAPARSEPGPVAEASRALAATSRVVGPDVLITARMREW